MLVALAGTLAALGLASGSATGQLTTLPGVDDPAGGQLGKPLLDPLPPPQDAVRRLAAPVQQVVHEPVPDPLEEIVQDSPLEPLREGVREVVGTPGIGAPGGGLPGGELLGGGSGDGGSSGREPANGGSAGDANPAGSAAGANSNPATPPPSPGGETGGPERSSGGGSGGGEAGGGPDGIGGGGDRRADSIGSGSSGRGSERRAGSGSDARGSGADAAQDADAGSASTRPDAPSEDEDDGPLVRTVNRIVEVVPRAVWIALGVLSLLALALFARSLVDRRRARALRSERERLLRDMDLLERVLLPQVPERLGDLAVSVAYRPAAGPAAGGDFYEVLELSGGRVALVVGDVCGHGREALARTSSLRPALRGHLEAGLSPSAALQAAGRAAGIDPKGGFTTAVVALHDASSGRLTYAMAGHPPPILVGPGAHDPPTVGSAPPIGVGLPTGVRQTTVSLPRGSAACFFTDGLLEARVGDSQLGEEWLAAVIAGFGPLDSAAVLLDRVIEGADATPDDMTACLIRAVAGSESIGPRVEELELGPDDVGARAPGRFLEACGVPGEAVAAALTEARGVIVQDGTALLTVTIDAGDASVQVTAPARGALTTT